MLRLPTYQPGLDWKWDVPVISCQHSHQFPLTANSQQAWPVTLSDSNVISSLETSESTTTATTIWTQIYALHSVALFKVLSEFNCAHFFQNNSYNEERKPQNCVKVDMWFYKESKDTLRNLSPYLENFLGRDLHNYPRSVGNHGNMFEHQCVWLQGYFQMHHKKMCKYVNVLFFCAVSYTSSSLL